jgi:hypothetical protein
MERCVDAERIEEWCEILLTRLIRGKQQHQKPAISLREYVESSLGTPFAQEAFREHSNTPLNTPLDTPSVLWPE